MNRPSKEFILREIRRCAEENDGKPLGRGRFEAQTGIRETHWSGRYWTRWGDALGEAGYEPNQLQGRRHEDAELLEYLATLTAELGRFPTAADLKMRRRQDDSFPSAKVFPLRLGGRDAQVAKLREFVANHDGYESVRSVVGEPVDSWHPGDANESEPRTDAGYVYLIKSGRHHKIGRTNHLGRRSYEIALQLPEKSDLVHVLETDDAVGIERYWHERFADRRANGEWFKLTAADIAAFKRRGKYM